MKSGATLISVISELMKEGKTNSHIAQALNDQGYRTLGKGCLWTASSIVHFRRKNSKVFEQVANERLHREWASIPMPKFPYPGKAEMLAGVPFLDTGFDGELDLPAPIMKRTR